MSVMDQLRELLPPTADAEALFDRVARLEAALAARDAELVAWAEARARFVGSDYDADADDALKRAEERLLAALAASPAAEDGPYPAAERERHLAVATEHLLRFHDCDHIGWETWAAALKASRRATRREAPEDSTEEGQA